MRFGYCYKSDDDKFSLTVDREVLEVLVDRIEQKARIAMEDGEIEECVALLNDWAMLRKMLKEEE